MGEIDSVEDEQPLEAPPTASLAGKWLEVCWRYWREPTDA